MADTIMSALCRHPTACFPGPTHCCSPWSRHSTMTCCTSRLTVPYLSQGRGVTACDLNLLCLVDFLKPYQHISHYICWQHNGDIVIKLQTSQPDFFHKLMKATHINGHPITPYFPPNQYVNHGNFKHPELGLPYQPGDSSASQSSRHHLCMQERRLQHVLPWLATAHPYPCHHHPWLGHGQSHT